MWVMTDLEADAGLRIYLARMKLEESLRDLKSLLGIWTFAKIGILNLNN
jgi:hypothetical protein